MWSHFGDDELCDLQAIFLNHFSSLQNEEPGRILIAALNFIIGPTTLVKKVQFVLHIVRSALGLPSSASVKPCVLHLSLVFLLLLEVPLSNQGALFSALLASLGHCLLPSQC